MTEEDFKNSEALRQAVDIINSLSKEELNNLTKITKEAGIELKDLPIFQGAIGLDILNLEDEGPIIAKIDTHKEVKVTVIKNDGNIANN